MRQKITATFLVMALGFAACLMTTLTSRGATTRPTPVAANPLVGIWEMTVQGNSTYLYKYAISDGTWVANGNIDRGFLNYTFSPTTGAYLKNVDGSYSYRERGWTYTRGGVCTGTFESTGTFVLNASETTFSGPGIFKVFDLNGQLVLSENLSVIAVKIPV